MLNALELGPGTVLGEKTTLIDLVAQALGNIIAPLPTETYNNLEVEVRLGRIMTKPVGKLGAERLNLPIKTEAIMRGGGYYNFRPGVREDFFLQLVQKLEAAIKNKDIVCSTISEHCIDTTFQKKDPNLRERLRCSEFVDAKGKVLDTRVVKKRSIGHVDVYTGYRPPEKGPCFDYRAAVNVEEVVPNFVKEEYVAILKRVKRRTSYAFSAWRIDVTDVITTPLDVPVGDVLTGRQKPPISRQSLEVELEIQPAALVENLMAKADGRAHKLWELLTDFLFAARDMTGLAAELSPLTLPPALPASAAVPSGDAQSEADSTKLNPALEDADREAYRKKYVAMPEPVIGHYLYRLARPRQPVAGKPRPSPPITSEPAPAVKRTSTVAGLPAGP